MASETYGTSETCRSSSTVRRSTRKTSPGSSDVLAISCVHSSPCAHASTRPQMPPSSGTEKERPRRSCASSSASARSPSTSRHSNTASDVVYATYTFGRTRSSRVDASTAASWCGSKSLSATSIITSASHSSLSPASSDTSSPSCVASHSSSAPYCRSTSPTAKNCPHAPSGPAAAVGPPRSPSSLRRNISSASTSPPPCSSRCLRFFSALASRARRLRMRPRSNCSSSRAVYAASTSSRRGSACSGNSCSCASTHSTRPACLSTAADGGSGARLGTRRDTAPSASRDCVASGEGGAPSQPPPRDARGNSSGPSASGRNHAFGGGSAASAASRLGASTATACSGSSAVM
mmetsp:Transcript_24254/g.64031  ORF Transcript_24254/g.64031 Transcript_24254/m.64031 type:complete len:349 (-) Transcript_24254:735-1781(-)